jgi:type IX secretion system PorP/SprF family membrane protein
MSVKKYKSVLALCVVVTSLYGQQTPQISHYMFNTPMYNPASAGFTNSVNASGIHRQQWYGFEDAPQQTHISIDAPIRAIQSGVGLSFINDRIGSFDNTMIQLNYNYQIPFLDGTLGMGIQFGVNSMGLNQTNLNPEHNDPILQNKAADASQLLFDVGMGLFYTVTDQYEIGVSIPLTTSYSENLGFTQERTLNLSANYNFQLDQFPKIDFVPSTLMRFNIFKSKSPIAKTHNVPVAQNATLSAFQMDISLIGYFDKQSWGGISYRLGDAVVLLGGLNLAQFQLPLHVGLAYDIATNAMSRASKIGGGFEVFVRYSFNLSVDRAPQSWKNSRFL